MIVLIDGPEKAGKSTLAATLASVLHGTVRHWGPVSPDDRVYTPLLKQDCASTNWVIWDRGWPSEYVYGKLLHRDRRLVSDPWLGEWLHGRAVQTAGLRVILTPRDPLQLMDLRTVSDLPVSPIIETQTFIEYGNAYGYLMLKNDYTPEGDNRLINSIVSRLGTANTFTPPAFAGPINARVVFVGEELNGNSRVPGAWLPFTSRLTMELGRRLGDRAFWFGWTNVGDVSLEYLSNKFVVACGEKAGRWLDNSSIVRLVIPHPAWLYRYSNARTLAKRELVDKFLTVLGVM